MLIKEGFLHNKLAFCTHCMCIGTPSDGMWQWWLIIIPALRDLSWSGSWTDWTSFWAVKPTSWLELHHFRYTPLKFSWGPDHLNCICVLLDNYLEVIKTAYVCLEFHFLVYMRTKFWDFVLLFPIDSCMKVASFFCCLRKLIMLFLDHLLHYSCVRFVTFDNFRLL